MLDCLSEIMPLKLPVVDVVETVVGASPEPFWLPDTPSPAFEVES
jgi:hypothetical protein